ncbi:MAG: alpha/beta fold hydrolase [Chloroflexi bacterium]|nr:alpha/beta fold hydrolase [Chloroflexota bacterium]
MNERLRTAIAGSDATSGQMLFTTSDRTRLAYRTRGDGPLVALIHGGLVHSVTWDEAAGALAADGFRVLTYDVRGYGQSDRPRAPGAYSIANSANDLAQLIEHLDAGLAHVVGFSQGGMIAIALAAERPDLVRALALVSTTARMTPQQAELFRARAARVEEAGLEDETAVYLGRVLSADFATSHPDLLAEYAEIVRSNHVSALAATFRALAETDLTAAASSIRVPTLILGGSEDFGMAPDVHAMRLHALIPGSTIEVWSGVGHRRHLERPREFVERLRAFFQQDEADRRVWEGQT